MEREARLENIKKYYGEVLQTNKDLKTDACCSYETLPPTLLEKLRMIHPEVQEKYYGCGSPIPPQLSGCTALDLGCGAGRDVYLLSQLVESCGHVIGIDMTEAQIEVAKKHLDYHMDQFGYKRSNVTFLRGTIECLQSLGIESESIDVVVSNCVLNLSPDKASIFEEIFRVLKPGGELYFSDIFASRRIPEGLSKHPIFLGECLGGALYIEDFRRLLRQVGCLDYRVVAKRKIGLNSAELEERSHGIDFYSITVRTFKLTFEDLCEDYGQAVRYLGTIAESPDRFILDSHHRFDAGKYVPVCGNTAAMLSETRFARHFEVLGDRSRHFGPFPCSPGPAPSTETGRGCC